MHKILIVDDEKAARELIAKWVVGAIPNTKVTQIENPQMALSCIEKEDFDMLFLDIRMPEMNGLELLELIKRNGKEPFTVIISAHCEFEYAVKGMELGVVKYITKPLYKEKVLEAISLYLQRAKLNMLELKVPDGIRRVEISQIIAIETTARGRVKVYTTTQIISDVTGTLSQLQKKLPAHFHYIKRDCLINRNHILGFNIKTQEVVMVCGNKEIRFVGSRERVNELRIEN